MSHVSILLCPMMSCLLNHHICTAVDLSVHVVLNKTHASMFAVDELPLTHLAHEAQAGRVQLHRDGTAYRYDDDTRSCSHYAECGWEGNLLQSSRSHACIKISLDPSCTCQHVYMVILVIIQFIIRFADIVLLKLCTSSAGFDLWRQQQHHAFVQEQATSTYPG